MNAPDPSPMKTFLMYDGNSFGQIESKALPIRVVEAVHAVKCVEDDKVLKSKYPVEWPTDLSGVPHASFVKQGMLVIGVRGEGFEAVAGKIIQGAARKLN